MISFSVSLSFLFTERPFLHRFAEARRSGFGAVEYMFPYEYEPRDLRRALDRWELTQVAFNLPAGDWDGGDRGIAADPARAEEFRAGVEEALRYAETLEVHTLNCLVGIRRRDVPESLQRQALVENLRFAAERLARRGRRLLIEPVNDKDVPGFLLSTSGAAVSLLEEVGADNLGLQLDLYHMQRMQGDLTTTALELVDRIGHVQIADCPGRHEPGTGEIDYRFVLSSLAAGGYDGFVGLEYIPSGVTEESFSWIEKMGFQR